MNLIEIAEDLKDVPDQYLMQEVQQPTGNFPAYLVISELSRRKRMRDKVAKEMPAQTVAEELATPPQPQMPPQMAPQGLMAMPQAMTELAAQDAMGTTPPEMMMPTQTMASGGIVSFRDGGDVQRFQNQGLVTSSPFERFIGFDPAATERRREENRLRNAIRQKYGMASDVRGFFMDQTDEERAKAQEVMNRLKTLQTESPTSLEELRALLGQTESPTASPSAAPAAAPAAQAAAPAAAPASPPPRDIRSAFATPSPVTIPERQSDYAIQTARAQRMSDYEQAVPDRLTPFLRETITKREGDIESRRASNINDALIQAGLGAMRAKPKFSGTAGLFEVLGAGGQEGFNVLREGRKDIRQSEEATLSARAKMMEAQSLRDQNKFKLADEVDKQARDEYKLGIDLANTQSAMNLRTLQGNIALAGAPADIALKEAQAYAFRNRPTGLDKTIATQDQIAKARINAIMALSLNKIDNPTDAQLQAAIDAQLSQSGLRRIGVEGPVAGPGSGDYSSLTGS